jgi:hypothetical protein
MAEKTKRVVIPSPEDIRRELVRAKEEVQVYSRLLRVCKRAAQSGVGGECVASSEGSTGRRSK